VVSANNVSVPTGCAPTDSGINPPLPHGSLSHQRAILVRPPGRRPCLRWATARCLRDRYADPRIGGRRHPGGKAAAGNPARTAALAHEAGPPPEGARTTRDRQDLPLPPL